MSTMRSVLEELLAEPRIASTPGFAEAAEVAYNQGAALRETVRQAFEAWGTVFGVSIDLKAPATLTPLLANALLDWDIAGSMQDSSELLASGYAHLLEPRADDVTSLLRALGANQRGVHVAPVVREYFLAGAEEKCKRKGLDETGCFTRPFAPVPEGSWKEHPGCENDDLCKRKVGLCVPRVINRKCFCQCLARKPKPPVYRPLPERVRVPETKPAPRPSPRLRPWPEPARIPVEVKIAVLVVVAVLWFILFKMPAPFAVGL